MAESVSPLSDFPVRVVDGFAVVTTPDEIDVGNAARFRAALLTAADHGQRAIIVDMTGTEFCDSTGLNVLVRALRQADGAGGELRLAVGGTALQRVLAVTGVATMFGVYPSLGEALQAAEPRQAG
jgi:anti-sigma B factor antagonist